MRDPRKGSVGPDDAADEVSWRVIEPGTPVFASDGTPVGRVTHVLGDSERDIFDGVGFRHHLWTAPRMAAAADIARITARRIFLRLSTAEVERCPAYQEEQVYRIGTTGFFRHREGWRKSDRD